MICMRLVRQSRLWTVLLIAALGCSPGEELGRISGVVTFENQPLERGVVMFANQANGVYMTAPIQANGAYSVEMAKGSGLPLGEYQVAVAPPPLDHPIGPILNPPQATDEPQFPLKYRSWDTSPLRVTIERGNNVLNIQLEE
jgi:hypothetical protein